ncbi:hypothetical protein ACI2K4_09310 [Micromonospora sp. NPDC050397]|uniref:hypothetical protein n=1 Tax=Micromonospora sp. NPDC050397 TaxID=3364279 RepID=UPI00384D964C
MSNADALAEIIATAGSSGTIALLIWSAPSIARAAIEALAAATALWHPDQDRRIEAGRTLRQLSGDQRSSEDGT